MPKVRTLGTPQTTDLVQIAFDRLKVKVFRKKNQISRIYLMKRGRRERAELLTQFAAA